MTKLNVRDANTGDFVEVDLDNPSGTLYVPDYNTGELIPVTLGGGSSVSFASDAEAAAKTSTTKALNPANLAAAGVLPKALTDYTNIVVVDSGVAGDYTTLSAALAAITDASVQKQYAVVMMPGVYNLVNTYLELKAYCHVMSFGGLGTVTINCDANSGVETAAGFTSGECRLSGLIITGVLEAVNTMSTGKIILDHCNLITTADGMAALTDNNGSPIEAYDCYIESNQSGGTVSFGVNAVRLLERCRIVNLAANSTGVYVNHSGTASGLKMRFCTVNSGQYSVAANSTKNISITHCGMNKVLNNVTITVTTPNNVIDASVVVVYSIARTI